MHDMKSVYMNVRRTLSARLGPVVRTDLGRKLARELRRDRLKPFAVYDSGGGCCTRASFLFFFFFFIYNA